MPSVSVVIPTYNHQQYLPSTLDSVFGQTFTDYEVIVINDGSPDDTAALLKPLAESSRIRYIEQPNAGQAAARNRGLKEARGEFVALLDDDDIWPADKLEWQVGRLRESPQVGLVAGDRIWWHGDEAEPDVALDPTRCRTLTFEALFEGNPIASPGQVTIRRDLLDRVGGFDASIWGADDYDLWFRLTRITRFEVYERVALLYRAHATNASANLDRMLWNTWRVIQAHAAALPAAEMPERLHAANRWMYEYLGSRLLARFKAEMAAGNVRAAARTFRALSSFAEWGITDKALMGRFLHELFPLREMLVHGLPSPVVRLARRAKRLGRPPPKPPVPNVDEVAHSTR